MVPSTETYAATQHTAARGEQARQEGRAGETGTSTTDPRARVDAGPSPPPPVNARTNTQKAVCAAWCTRPATPNGCHCKWTSHSTMTFNSNTQEHMSPDTRPGPVGLRAAA